jgi:putative transposase
MLVQQAGMESHYPSDVSDAEWALLESFFIDSTAPRKRGRIETSESARRSFNAVRYLLKTGCQWRMLPKEYPARTTVHDAFTRWTKSGLWERINNELREQRRIGVKKTLRPARPS